MKNIKTLITIALFAVLIFSCDEDGNNSELINNCEDALDNWTMTSFDFPEVQLQNDLFFPTDDIGYSVGNFGTILKTINGGEDWKILEQFSFNNNQVTKLGSSSNLRSVHFLDSEIGFIGGASEKDYRTSIKSDAVLIRTSDGGLNWEKSYLSGVRDVIDLFFYDEMNGIGMFHMQEGEGRKQSVMTTSDGGVKWVEIDIEVNNFELYKFVIAGDNIMIFTEKTFRSNQVIITSDNGLNWESFDLPEGINISSAYFVNEEIGFISGGYKTIDGGRTWNEVELPFKGFSLMNFDTESKGFVLNDVYNIDCDSDYQICIPELSYYEMYETSDYGENWTKTKVDGSCDFLGHNSYSPSKGILYTLSSSQITRFELK